MKQILDAHGLMVFLEKEPGYEKIESLFTSAVEKNDYLLITSVNLGEVYYIILRECGEDKAQEVEEIIQTLPCLHASFFLRARSFLYFCMILLQNRSRGNF